MPVLNSKIWNRAILTPLLSIAGTAGLIGLTIGQVGCSSADREKRQVEATSSSAAADTPDASDELSEEKLESYSSGSIAGVLGGEIEQPEHMNCLTLLLESELFGDEYVCYLAKDRYHAGPAGPYIRYVGILSPSGMGFVALFQEQQNELRLEGVVSGFDDGCSHKVIYMSDEFREKQRAFWEDFLKRQ